MVAVVGQKGGGNNTLSIKQTNTLTRSYPAAGGDLPPRRSSFEKIESSDYQVVSTHGVGVCGAVGGCEYL